LCKMIPDGSCYRPLNVPGIEAPKLNLKVGPPPGCGHLPLRPIRKLRVFSRRKVAVPKPRDKPSKRGFGWAALVQGVKGTKEWLIYPAQFN
jgi:hypothetical protein